MTDPLAEARALLAAMFPDNVDAEKNARTQHGVAIELCRIPPRIRRMLAEHDAAEHQVEKRLPRAERPRCGARCRDGHACRAPVVVLRKEDGSIEVKARCRMHGGLSTGARTAEGRARLREAGRKGAAERWRQPGDGQRHPTLDSTENGVAVRRRERAPERSPTERG